MTEGDVITCITCERVVSLPGEDLCGACLARAHQKPPAVLSARSWATKKGKRDPR